MIASEHAKIAFSSIAHLHNTWISLKEFETLTEDQKTCIQEISTKVMKQRAIIGGEDKIIDVEYVKIKLFDKQKALTALADYLGLTQP